MSNPSDAGQVSMHPGDAGEALASSQGAQAILGNGTAAGHAQHSPSVYESIAAQAQQAATAEFSHSSPTPSAQVIFASGQHGGGSTSAGLAQQVLSAVGQFPLTTGEINIGEPAGGATLRDSGDGYFISGSLSGGVHAHVGETSMHPGSLAPTQDAGVPHAPDGGQGGQPATAHDGTMAMHPGGHPDATAPASPVTGHDGDGHGPASQGDAGVGHAGSADASVDGGYTPADAGN